MITIKEMERKNSYSIGTYVRTVRSTEREVREKKLF